MKVKTIVSQDVSAKDLAYGLWNGTAQDFADFWMEIYTLHKDDGVRGEDKLQAIAKFMAPSLGAGRKVVFDRLHSLIRYEEELAKKKPEREKEED